MIVYTYFFASGQFWLRHTQKRTGLNIKGHEFKVVGKSGILSFYLDDDWFYDYPIPERHYFKEWGFLVHGYGIIQIDDFLLLGTTYP
jgi:hypothetical protein